MFHGIERQLAGVGHYQPLCDILQVLAFVVGVET